MTKINFLFLLLFFSVSSAQLKLKYPTNVRYIAGGYENKPPFFNNLESALNSVYSSVSQLNPYVFWIDGDTSMISDWKHGVIKGKMGMADSIDIYYVATGKIKWAGFIGSGNGGYSKPILYMPDDRTVHYGYPRWQYESYSAWYDSLSRGISSIDQDIYDLIVYTDTSWLYIENDTLKLKSNRITPLTSGTGRFAGTAISDTILIPGAKVTDIYFVSPVGPCPTCGSDNLRVEAVTNKAIVWRNSQGTNNLSYYWIRVGK